MNTKPRMFVLPDGRNVLFTFVLVTSLFFLWGLCNGMIDVMDKHFKDELKLTYAQTANVQLAHYLGYFLMALPAGWLSNKLGYKGGIIAGLLMVAAGGFWFIPATQIAEFWAFLLGVCFIAAGLTFLETIANPYTTVLGSPQFGATRINLAQSFNGIGALLGPLLGAAFFYGKDAEGASTGAEQLWIPYAGIAVGVLVLAAVFFFANVPDIKAEDDYHIDDNPEKAALSIWARPHFVLAVAAQFVYVAGQASFFAFFIIYITTQTPAIPDAVNAGMTDFANHLGMLKNSFLGWFAPNPQGILAVSDKGGACLVTVAMSLFLAGRLLGASLMRKVAPHKILGLFGAANVVTCLLIFLHLGWVSVAAVFAAYFFMSIMFPTIFALGIFGLGSKAKNASSFIVMAIMGGALLPKLMGYIADHHGLSSGYIVPMFCFAFVAFYGFSWSKFSGATSLGATPKLSGH